MEPVLLNALKATSRSFWLSLRFLPLPTRDPIAIAYTLARLADTIADTDCVELQQRIRLIEAFQERLVCRGSQDIYELGEIFYDEALTDGEKDLLSLVRTAFAALDNLEAKDAELTRGVLKTLSDGMLQDAKLFVHQEQGVTAVQSMEQLDEYCYMVAGCVGQYWTDIHEAHLSSMTGLLASLKHLGIRFGKGLQLVNILRDLPADLQNGRCYLPEQKLHEIGLVPADLLEPEAEDKIKPLLGELMLICRQHLDAGREYLRRLPGKEFRLRLCTTWPLQIAIKTLKLIERNSHPLDPYHKVKISRRAVYGIMLRSINQGRRKKPLPTR